MNRPLEILGTFEDGSPADARVARVELLHQLLNQIDNPRIPDVLDAKDIAQGFPEDYADEIDAAA